MKRLRSWLILLALVGTAARSWSADFRQSARSVDRFDFVEVTLTLDEMAKGNPFIDAEFSGVFQSPATDGKTPLMPSARVDGFCDSDDGRVFRIRFMPTVGGKHTYSVVFRNGGTELRHSGGFDVRAGRRQGLVVRDPAFPTHFKWSGSGGHFFYNSTTAYWLLGFRNDAVIRESIDRLDRLKVDRIRVALSGRTESGMRWKEPMIVSDDAFQFRLGPWPAARPLDIADPGYDVSRFDLGHFRKAERMLAHARGRDLQVSLIFALDVADKGVDPFGKAAMGDADEQRYYRYCVARFGAFANVWWDLINEWHLCRDEAWAEKLGTLVRRWDPYGHTMSIHGTGRFPFGRSPWADYVMFQSWDESGGHDFMLKARRDQIAAGRSLPIVNEEYGYEDHYPFPWGGKRVWPARIGEDRVRLAWEMTMAGGHQTTGERANIAGMGGWITGRGNDAMTMLQGYGRMRSFFESIPWWELEPRPDLVTGESKALPVPENSRPIAPALLLAKPGERYVVYLRQGGSAALQLGPVNFAVTRFDPRSGRSLKVRGLVTGDWTTPAVPDTENWVFLLEKR